MHLSEILYHLGEDRSQYFNAVSPPVIQSSNFAFNTIADFRQNVQNELKGRVYSRGNNPTTEILRKKVAALEHTEDALCFSSGSGAIAAALISCVKAGDHVICVRSPYSWTYALLTKFLARFDVSCTFVDGTLPSDIEAAVRPNTTVLYLESPNSIIFELQDLDACAAIAKRHGLVSMIDNSFCTPLYQNPADHGIDLVIHTATKYLNGHSDVVAGIVCGSSALIQRMFDSEFMTLGGILAPHDANLIIRGLRTLPMRLERSSQSAAKVIDYLAAHPRTRRVVWPFHPTFPQYELARRQMRGCSGLFGMEFDFETLQQAEDFFHALRFFTFAVSWGGHESLVFPTCALFNIPGRPEPTLPVSYYRFYVGLEDPDFLIADLEQALASVS